MPSMSKRRVPSATLHLVAWLLVTPLTAHGFEMYDIMPDIDAITFDGPDVLFGEHIRLPGGDLSRWPKPETRIRAAPALARPSCDMPDVALPVPEGQRKQVLACSVDYMWVAGEVYCSEGLRDSSGVFRVNRHDNTFEQFHWLPACEQPTALIEAGGSIWIGTSRPIEKYREQPGSGVIRVTMNGDRIDMAVSFVGLTVTALNASDDAVWAVGYEGIGKLDLSNGEATLRYFDFGISDSDELISLLVEQPPDSERILLFTFLSRIPITAKEAFMSILAFEQKRGRYSVDSPPLSLVPFYIQAARRFEVPTGNLSESQQDNWDFAYLLHLIMHYRGDFPTEVRKLLQDLKSQRHTDARRKIIMEAVNGMDDPQYKPDRTRAFQL